jgi:acyl dehydratase
LSFTRYRYPLSTLPRNSHELSIRRPRGRYFEDFEIGKKIGSLARTITQTNIVNFACLSGDFNEVHTNFEYCKKTQLGEPIAHEPLVDAVIGGLNMRVASMTEL